MRKTTIFFAIVLLALALAGCSRASQQASTEVRIELLPLSEAPMVGESHLQFRLTDSAGRPLKDASLKIKGDMTHAGMQPQQAEVTGGDDRGIYQVPFHWTMGGDWILTVDAALADGARGQERFELSVAGGMAGMDEHE